MKKYLYMTAVAGLLVGCGGDISISDNIAKASVSGKDVMIYKNINILYAPIAKEFSKTTFDGDFFSNYVNSSFGCKYLGATYIGTINIVETKISKESMPFALYFNKALKTSCAEVDMSKTTMSGNSNILHASEATIEK